MSFVEPSLAYAEGDVSVEVPSDSSGAEQSFDPNAVSSHGSSGSTTTTSGGNIDYGPGGYVVQGALSASSGSNYYSDGSNYSSGGSNYSSDGSDYSSDGSNYSSDGSNYSSDGSNYTSDGSNYSSDGSNFSSEGSNYSSDGSNYSSEGSNYSSDGSNYSSDGSSYSSGGSNYSVDGGIYLTGGSSNSSAASSGTSSSVVESGVNTTSGTNTSTATGTTVTTSTNSSTGSVIVPQTPTPVITTPATTDVTVNPISTNGLDSVALSVQAALASDLQNYLPDFGDIFTSDFLQTLEGTRYRISKRDPITNAIQYQGWLIGPQGTQIWKYNRDEQGHIQSVSYFEHRPNEPWREYVYTNVSVQHDTSGVAQGMHIFGAFWDVNSTATNIGLLGATNTLSRPQAYLIGRLETVNTFFSGTNTASAILQGTGVVSSRAHFTYQQNGSLLSKTEIGYNTQGEVISERTASGDLINYDRSDPSNVKVSFKSAATGETTYYVHCSLSDSTATPTFPIAAISSTTYNRGTIAYIQVNDPNGGWYRKSFGTSLTDITRVVYSNGDSIELGSPTTTPVQDITTRVITNVVTYTATVTRSGHPAETYTQVKGLSVSAADGIQIVREWGNYAGWYNRIEKIVYTGSPSGLLLKEKGLYNDSPTHWNYGRVDERKTYQYDAAGGFLNLKIYTYTPFYSWHAAAYNYESNKLTEVKTFTTADPTAADISNNWTEKVTYGYSYNDPPTDYTRTTSRRDVNGVSSDIDSRKYFFDQTSGQLARVLYYVIGNNGVATNSMRLNVFVVPKVGVVTAAGTLDTAGIPSDGMYVTIDIPGQNGGLGFYRAYREDHVTVDNIDAIAFRPTEDRTHLFVSMNGWEQENTVFDGQGQVTRQVTILGGYTRKYARDFDVTHTIETIRVDRFDGYNRRTPEATITRYYDAPVPSGHVIKEVRIQPFVERALFEGDMTTTVFNEYDSTTGELIGSKTFIGEISGLTAPARTDWIQNVVRSVAAYAGHSGWSTVTTSTTDISLMHMQVGLHVDEVGTWMPVFDNVNLIRGDSLTVATVAVLNDKGQVVKVTGPDAQHAIDSPTTNLVDESVTTQFYQYDQDGFLTGVRVYQGSVGGDVALATGLIIEEFYSSARVHGSERVLDHADRYINGRLDSTTYYDITGLRDLKTETQKLMAKAMTAWYANSSDRPNDLLVRYNYGRAGGPLGGGYSSPRTSYAQAVNSCSTTIYSASATVSLPTLVNAYWANGLAGQNQINEHALGNPRYSAAPDYKFINYYDGTSNYSLDANGNSTLVSSISWWSTQDAWGEANGMAKVLVLGTNPQLVGHGQAVLYDNFDLYENTGMTLNGFDRRWGSNQVNVGGMVYSIPNASNDTYIGQDQNGRAMAYTIVVSSNLDSVSALPPSGTLITSYVVNGPRSGEMITVSYIQRSDINLVQALPGVSGGSVTNLASHNFGLTAVGTPTSLTRDSATQFSFGYASGQVAGASLALGNDTIVPLDGKRDSPYDLSSGSLVFNVTGTSTIRMRVANNSGQNVDLTFALDATHQYVELTAAKLQNILTGFNVANISSVSFIVDAPMGPGTVTVTTAGLA